MAAAAAGLGWLALSGCTTTTDHHYVFPRGGGDLLAAEVEAAAAVGLRFHPTRGSMDLGGQPGRPAAGLRRRGHRRRAAPRPRRRSPVPRPVARRDGADRGRAVLAVLGDGEADDRGGRAGPAARRPAAHPPRRDRRRGGVLPRAVRLHAGGVRRLARLARRRRLAGARRAPRRRRGRPVRRHRHRCRALPVDNARLGAGIARTRDLLDAGVPVGLGVDGAASNEAGSLVEELRHAALFARAARRADGADGAGGVAAGDDGRRPVLGRADEIGSLEVGKLADLALWRLDTLAHAGIADPVAALVFGPHRRWSCCWSAAGRSSRATGWSGSTRTSWRGTPTRRRSCCWRGAPDDRTGQHSGPHRRRCRHRRGPAGRHPEGDRRVRLRLRPVGRRHALGRHAAQPAPGGPDPVASTSGRRWRCPASTRCSPPTTSRARSATAWSSTTSRCSRWTSCATRASRWRWSRPSTRRPPGGRPRGSWSTTRCSSRSTDARGGAGSHVPRGAPGADAGRGAQPRGGAAAPARQPGPAPEDPQGRHRRGRGRHRLVVVRATTRSACRTRRSSGRSPGSRCPARTAGSTSTSPPSGCTSTSSRSAAPRPAAGEGAAHAGRRRRRVRRPRGPVDAGARLHARAAHRQAGEDVVQPRGVVLRPRAPAPGGAALRARRHPGRRPGLRQGHDLARRRGVRVQQRSGRRQRGAAGHRPVRRAERADGLLRRLHEQPAVRRDARLRRGAGRFAYESQMDKAAAALGIDPVELRCRNAMEEGSVAPTGQVVDSAGAGGRAAAPAAATCRCRPSGSARTCGSCPAASRTPPTARASSRRRLRRRHQEHLLLRGLRRLLDRAGAARGDRRRAGGHGAHRRGRGGPGPGHRRSSRSPAPSSASTGCRSRRRTRPSAAAGRRRRPGRRT